MASTHRLLPAPGALWGEYPQRDADAAPARVAGAASPQRTARAAERHARRWSALDSAARAAEWPHIRAALRRDGPSGDALARALGIAVAAAEVTLGLRARSSQLQAAAALLHNRMVEMATGEGKTLAIALAAAVAALAGMPVHVVTANGYLAGRDAAALAGFYAALGLRVAALAELDTAEQRRAKYRHDIVYATAKDLAFDFLRDRCAEPAPSTLQHAAGALGGTAAAPLMRGLCMALLDEADSILLDEAEVPLILSRSVPQAQRRAFLWQALALARQLVGGRDHLLQPADRVATLTPAGEERLAELSRGLGGPWQRARYRREAVTMALCALHLTLRNAHYVVRDGAIELLDEVTGRVAHGRVWSRGLHTLVALKEGLGAPAETETIAQTTFQRFFQRYWRLCGISGTLHEARAELRAVYAAAVQRIAPHRPSRCRTLPQRHFGDPAERDEAVAVRVAALVRSGRPVLVGTDSVDDSLRLSARLHAAGITHRVLNALHDADEAAIVAQAGTAGCVTVATRMAGRGTDIELDDAARAAGGLHVLCCQHNPSRRLDRQLAGRAGRRGDPGSTEIWTLAASALQPAAQTADTPPWNTPLSLLWFAPLRRRWQQHTEERRRRQLRRGLLEQDHHWERRLAFAGRSR